MSIPAVDTTESEQPEGAAPETQPGAGEGTQDPAPGAEEGATEDPKDDGDEDEPIEARLERRERELRNVRDEAAKRRNQVKDLEQQLAEAKTQEDIEAAVAEYRSKVEELEKQIAVSTLAQTHGLDENLTKVLAGFPADQLEEQAKLLAAYAPKRREGGTNLDDLSGGLTPGGGSVREGGDLSPVEAARRMRRRR